MMLQRYVLYQEGISTTEADYEETFLIYPQNYIFVEKQFPTLIKGIVVGAKAVDKTAFVSLVGGGVRQHFVKLKVQAASRDPTEVIIKITTD